MTSIDSIKQGLANYLDAELMPELEVGSVQKVLTGAAISIAIKRSDGFVAELTGNPILKQLGVIDENGGVDLDLLRDEIKAQIPETGMVIDSKLIGKMTFYANDIDKLYNYIKEV